MLRTEEHLLPGLQHVQTSPQIPHEGHALQVQRARLSRVHHSARGAVVHCGNYRRVAERKSNGGPLQSQPGAAGCSKRTWGASRGVGWRQQGLDEATRCAVAGQRCSAAATILPTILATNQFILFIIIYKNKHCSPSPASGLFAIPPSLGPSCTPTAKHTK